MLIVRSIAAWLVRGWLGSLRWRDGVSPSPDPVVFCVWHRDVPAAGAWLRHQPVTSLISASRDGDFLVEVLAGGTMRFARGSDSNHAVTGARALLRELRKGGSVATTWDGPKGPEGIPKPGPRWLADASRARLVELRFEYGPHLKLGDWSRLRIPLPWTRIDVTVST